MKEIGFDNLSKEIIQQLNKGAFLTVKDLKGTANTMTISWGSFGYMWFKPVFMVMVRRSRYTYSLIENAENFSVSFPLKNQLNKELEVCGTKSGRDIDKFKECGLSMQYLEDFETPVIEECDLHLNCKIIYKQPIDPSLFNEETEKMYGAAKDYHTLYYGEILSCRTKEDIL
jgi:flavin reductase (DIM6/NTAB) family NADH-FMN oxidoreductase RutF